MTPLLERAFSEAARLPEPDQDAVASRLLAELEKFPETPRPKAEWKLITFDGGKTKVPLSQLHDISYEDEAFRSLPHDDLG
jgi:hypothetical protein